MPSQEVDIAGHNTAQSSSFMGTQPPAPLSPMPASIQHAMGSRLVEKTPGLFSEAASLCPVGVFDSGVGGLSIVQVLRRVLPSEDIIYYADSGNCPYGGRTDEWLRSRALEVSDFLLGQGAKTVVVACNTASAAGLEHLRAERAVPIVGLVPAVKPAVEATKTGAIGVLSTQGTMRGRLLADVIERFAVPAGVRVVTGAPTGLVEAVERGELASPQTYRAVAGAVLPMLAQGVDTIVLGCTHYPFLAPTIQEIAGSGVCIIDSSMGVALQTRRVLEGHDIARMGERPGSLLVYTSGDPSVVGPVVQRLVGEAVAVLHESQAPQAVSGGPFTVGE